MRDSEYDAFRSARCSAQMDALEDEILALLVRGEGAMLDDPTLLETLETAQDSDAALQEQVATACDS